MLGRGLAQLLNKRPLMGQHSFEILKQMKRRLAQLAKINMVKIIMGMYFELKSGSLLRLRNGEFVMNVEFLSNTEPDHRAPGLAKTRK